MSVNKEMKFELGCSAQDKITGFSGIVTGFCCYLTGCDQYLLTPKVDEKGGYVNAKWFDVNRLDLTEQYEFVKIDTETDNGPCEPANLY